MNKRKTGTMYEEKAAEYLEMQGYQILKQNYRCRMGEIDIVCRDGKYLVFVEVKYRADRRQGGAFMAVTRHKQHKISQVAAFYLMEQRLCENTPCRFDVVAIDGDVISLLQNAFEYC